MKDVSRRWMRGIVAALALGTAVGVVAARGLTSAAASPPASRSLEGVPLPALDALVARLASEVRAQQSLR